MRACLDLVHFTPNVNMSQRPTDNFEERMHVYMCQSCRTMMANSVTSSVSDDCCRINNWLSLYVMLLINC